MSRKVHLFPVREVGYADVGDAAYFGFSEEELERHAKRLRALMADETLEGAFRVTHLWNAAYDVYDDEFERLDRDTAFEWTNTVETHYFVGIGEVSVAEFEKHTELEVFADLLRIDEEGKTVITSEAVIEEEDEEA